MIARSAILLGAAMVAAALGFYLGKPSKGGGNSATAEGSGSTSHSKRELAEITTPRARDELGGEVAGELETLLEIAKDDPLASLMALGEIEDDYLRIEVAFELIANLDAAQLGQIISHLDSAGEEEVEEKLENLFDSPMIPFAMLDRWVQLDPDAVADLALSPISDVPNELGLVFRVASIGFMAQSDPQRANEIAKQLRSNPALKEMGEDMGGPIIDFFIGFGRGVSDPAGAIRSMREGGMSASTMSGLDPIFELSGPHSADVLSEIMQFPASDERDELIDEVYETWGKYDLSEALASLEMLPAGEEKEQLMANILPGLLRQAAMSDPVLAIQKLGLLNSDEERQRSMGRIADLWVRNDPAAALAWSKEALPEEQFIGLMKKSASSLTAQEGRQLVDAMTEQQRFQFFESNHSINGDHFIMRMAAEDPAATVRWMQEMGRLEAVDPRGLAMVMARYGHAEESMALAESASPEDEDWNQFFKKRLIEESAANGERRWIDWAAAQGNDLHEQAVASWAGTDPQAAAEYAQGSGSAAIVVAAVDRWAGQDPAGAYEWAVESHEGDPEAIRSLLDDSLLLNQWSEQDPAAAAKALTGFPEEHSPDLISRVISSWAMHEPGRTSEFIAENLTTDGPLRDAAVETLVGQLASSRPDEARAWAESISDEESRNSTLEFLETGELRVD